MAHRNAATVATDIDQGLRTHMTRTYSLLSMGLAVTAAAAWLTMETPFHLYLAGPEGLTGLGMAVMFSPLVLLLAASFGLVGRTSTPLVYWAFVTLQGPGLGLLAHSYTDASVFNAAAAAAMTFGAASIYGYTTGRSLDGLGSFMFIGLIGLIGASILNLFMGSPAISFALSCAAVVVFTGLAAWETQKLKESYDETAGEGAMSVVRYMSALGLYLSVLNLFTALLSLMGERK